MKYSSQAIALFLCNLMFVLSVKDSPKALDLSNHYGTEPVTSAYGPKASLGTNLRREGVGIGGATTPILNFEKEINPTEVVAGDLDNTSFDASKIVTAALAKPKAEIKTVFHHEAVIKTPVHLGNQIEEKTVTNMNRMTGQVETEQVVSQKPILGLLNTVREVQTEHTTVIDMTNGKVINGDAPKVLHGNSK